MVQASVCRATSSGVEVLENYIGDGKLLAARVYVKKIIKKKISFNEWSDIRLLLLNNEKIGYDILFLWDKYGQTYAKSITEVENLIRQGDESLLSKKNAEAVEKYFKAALLIKKEIEAGTTDNELTYLKVLHNLARALFSQKEFSDALSVYELIPAKYYRFKQVLYEKMWSAFRAKKYDAALGAIASQRSKYLNEFIHPESYLVQLYIFKSLCREKDFNLTLQSIKSNISALESKRYKVSDWSQESLITRSLMDLANSQKIEAVDGVSSSEILAEKKSIKRKLTKAFSGYREQRLKLLNKILGYSRLAVIEKTPSLSRISELPTPEVLRAQSYEYWPVSDSEEWLDEQGLHFFVGGSRCQM